MTGRLRWGASRVIRWVDIGGRHARGGSAVHIRAGRSRRLRGWTWVQSPGNPLVGFGWPRRPQRVSSGGGAMVHVPGRGARSGRGRGRVLPAAAGGVVPSGVRSSEPGSHTVGIHGPEWGRGGEHGCDDRRPWAPRPGPGTLSAQGVVGAGVRSPAGRRPDGGCSARSRAARGTRRGLPRRGRIGRWLGWDTPPESEAVADACASAEAPRQLRRLPGLGTTLVASLATTSMPGVAAVEATPGCRTPSPLGTGGVVLEGAHQVWLVVVLVIVLMPVGVDPAHSRGDGSEDGRGNDQRRQLDREVESTVERWFGPPVALLHEAGVELPLHLRWKLAQQPITTERVTHVRTQGGQQASQRPPCV